jgi:hypothetical protein
MSDVLNNQKMFEEFQAFLAFKRAGKSLHIYYIYSLRILTDLDLSRS